ncbi:DUF5681 domain-containing protein [Sphingomonas sp. ID0503]|jgi:hypothetical protein|uniref:DUF5681 domain-containing protein n=1 Tax=Sphingomonas sp. ID0503 TaxID=3399691 RepID=UPI003AFB2403
MARKRNTGVGRGNGEGSRRTQFKDGMPSGNPEGRRRSKARALANTDLARAFKKALTGDVFVSENGRKRKAPLTEAIALSLMDSFNKANIR